MMPKLVRFYIRHVIIGYGLSVIFVGLLLWLNVANLGHLVLNSPVGWLATIMMVVFNGVVFSGVQFGIAVMLLSDDGPDSGSKSPVTQAEPIRVHSYTDKI